MGGVAGIEFQTYTLSPHSNLNMNNLVIRRYLPEDKEAVKELYKLASIHSEIGYRDGPWYKDFDTIEDFYLKGGDFLVGLIDNTLVVMVGLQKICPVPEIMYT